jgi:hypothetical protein
VARKVLTVCDLDDDDAPAAVVLQVQLGDDRWRLDLCEEHAQEVQQILAPLLGAAGATRTAGQSRQVSGSRRDRSAQRSTIREWARAHGFEVSDYGRLPREAVIAYQNDRSKQRGRASVLA